MADDLLTTEACLTEALYLVGKAGGDIAQDLLWSMIDEGDIKVAATSNSIRSRARVYMARYANLPCDYADATLAVVAEDMGIRRILTIDKHFWAYRLSDGSSFEVLPI